LTHVAVGCPVIAKGPGAEDLFIQVTHVDEDPQVWHVEVNNPTDTAITVTFHSGMELPGFPAIVTTPVTIVAGEFVVLWARDCGDCPWMLVVEKRMVGIEMYFSFVQVAPFRFEP
jgi:hypothetical protein